MILSYLTCFLFGHDFKYRLTNLLANLLTNLESKPIKCFLHRVKRLIGR